MEFQEINNSYTNQTQVRELNRRYKWSTMNEETGKGQKVWIKDITDEIKKDDSCTKLQDVLVINRKEKKKTRQSREKWKTTKQSNGDQGVEFSEYKLKDSVSTKED